MPTATGSISFLGASRFNGIWNAATNAGTGSGLPDTVGSGAYTPLFNTSSPTAGYHGSTGLTASQGDYWQVEVSGTTTVDGVSSWATNDWIIFSGSQWIKLDFFDTIASVVHGDLSKTMFHMGTANDKHVIFNSGSVHSGSSNFVYNYANDRVGIGSATPAYKLDVVGNIVGGTSANSHGHVSVRRDGSIVGGMNTQGGVFNFHGSSTVTDQHLTIRSSGKVGIGTADPTKKLHVDGEIFANGQIQASAFVNPQTLTEDMEIPANHNALINGPFTIQAAKTMTLAAGSVTRVNDI